MKDIKKITKGRKAQFYIFTAVVLIAYSTLLLQSKTVTPESSDAFRKAYDNFVFESGATLNNALFEQVNVNDEYDRFLDSFISYSKMKKLNIELVSILETGDYVYINNKMDNPVHLININQTIPAGTDTYFTRSNLSEAVFGDARGAGGGQAPCGPRGGASATRPASDHPRDPRLARSLPWAGRPVGRRWRFRLRRRRGLGREASVPRKGATNHILTLWQSWHPCMQRCGT